MDPLFALQKALEGECRKLHNGEMVKIAIGPQCDANAIHAIRTVMEELYRSMFQEDVAIQEIRRDEHGVLHMCIAKKEREAAG